jgi:pimeloyl-ACP methyl ester carboxylesterase
MGQYQDADEIPLLGQVKVPSLIVWGAQDRGKPAGEFDELKALLPAAATVYVETSGHYVQEEAPAETAAGMFALADTVMAGRAPAAVPPAPDAASPPPAT